VCSERAAGAVSAPTKEIVAATAEAPSDRARTQQTSTQSVRRVGGAGALGAEGEPSAGFRVGSAMPEFCQRGRRGAAAAPGSETERAAGPAGDTGTAGPAAGRPSHPRPSHESGGGTDVGGRPRRQ